MNSWLNESRDLFKSREAHWWMRLLGLGRAPRFADVCAGEEVSSAAARYYQLLLDGGMVVWGAIIQANHRAFMPGNDDLPAVVAFSPNSEFDDDPTALQEIAHRVFALKGQVAAEPDLAQIARLISDDYAEFHNERLPDSLTRGREVYMSAFIVNRRRLPTGRLTLQLVPLLADPARSPVVMILPLRYWAGSLVAQWQTAEAQSAAELAALPAAAEWGLDVARPLSQADVESVRQAYRDNPLTLTSAAAMQVRKIIAECDLPSGVSLYVLAEGAGSRRERKIKFSSDPPDLSRELRCHYEGFDVVTDIDSAANLTGVVLDFKDGIEASGFVFRDA